MSRQGRPRDQAQVEVSPQAERVEVDQEKELPKSVAATESFEEPTSSQTGYPPYENDSVKPKPSVSSVPLAEHAPPHAVSPPTKKKTLLKPVKPGQKEAHFDDNDWWEDYGDLIGTKTRKISFGSRNKGFQLAD